MRGGNIGRDANALKMRDFIDGTLFDGNVLAIRYGQIESGNGRGNIKRHIIFFGEDGDLVRADFVGGVPVRGDAVRAGNDRADFSRFQKVPRHIVGDERQRNTAFVEFPRRKASALKIRPRLGHKYVERSSWRAPYGVGTPQRRYSADA